MNKIYIKNMVCPRCIMAVRTLLHNCGIEPLEVSLGEVQLPVALTDERRIQLSHELELLGFELLEDSRQQQVELIRSAVIEWIKSSATRVKLSTFLQTRIARDYSTLSKLFSEIKGITIEQYMKEVRIECVKEELCYGQKNVSELAYEYGFSSLAHLSSQFKSLTGMSPKQFQQLDRPKPFALRNSLDKI